MPVPAHTVKVALTVEETNYIWDFVQAEYPNMTAAQIVNKLESVARDAIVQFVKEEIRRKQRAAQRLEDAALEFVFNPPVDPEPEPATP